MRNGILSVFPSRLPEREKTEPGIKSRRRNFIFHFEKRLCGFCRNGGREAAARVVVVVVFLACLYKYPLKYVVCMNPIPIRTKISKMRTCKG